MKLTIYCPHGHEKIYVGSLYNKDKASSNEQYINQNNEFDI
jgi:hypothetical protein